MKKRSNLMAAAGVLASLIGMLFVFVYTARVKASAGTQLAATSTAFVATSDIAPGTSWENMTGSVKEQKVPPELRPASAVSEPDELEGKASVRTISRGEIVTRLQFDATRSGSLPTPKGYDAVTINVGSAQGVAQYVQPGVKANIYVSFKGAPTTDPADGVVTKLLLSNVAVLANRAANPGAAEGEAEQPDAGSDVLLTLAVTPEQAEKLIFAKENGSIWLGLPHSDNGVATTSGRTFKTVLL
jgi:pilus assembly protein CpaB